MSDAVPSGDLEGHLDEGLEELRAHEYRDAARAMRSRGFTIPFALTLVALAFAPALPSIGAFAGFGVAVSAPIFLAMLGVHLVLVALEHRKSRLYVIVDALETALHVAAYGFMIVCSGRALSVPWFFLSMNVHMVPLHPWPWVHRTAYVVMPAVVALFFELHGQRNDALLTLVLGAGVLMILRVSTSAAVERMRSRLRIADLERQLDRSRIARELHDGIGADLTAVILKARTAADRATGEEKETLAALVTRARATLAELRSIVWAVRQPSVSLSSLVAQIRIRAAELVPSPISCAVDSDVAEDEVLSGELAVLVMRVVQEAVNNAARHAGATAVEVRLRGEGDALHLEVADDGTFRSNDAPGHGLANLRHRVEQVGGAFELDAAPRGTTLRVRLRRQLRL